MVADREFLADADRAKLLVTPMTGAEVTGHVAELYTTPAPLVARAKAMRSVNPNVVPRNHRVEEALAAASDHGDLAPFQRLLNVLRQPYDESHELVPYAEPAPAAVTACYRTFCGT